MITDFFKYQTQGGKPAPIIHEFYELHRGFIDRNQFSRVFNEVKPYIEQNGGRRSCVCLNVAKHHSSFKLYALPLVDWTPTITTVRQRILDREHNKTQIDYGLVHYYHDETATIAWHSDREALRSPIYSVSFGGVRRFCLRNKETQKVETFDLCDGDLFIMKGGCQDRFEHCIKSVKSFNAPRISITFRQLEKPICLFIYDRVNRAVLLNEPSSPYSYRIITTTRQGIVVGLINTENNNNSSTVWKSSLPPSTYGHSLLKSNLQKAIRRQNEDVAIWSALQMITDGFTTELLRRLTIISFEDVQLTQYYPVIVWMYVAITAGYELTTDDVLFLRSYIKLLCCVQTTHQFEGYKKKKASSLYLTDFCDNVVCVALYMRVQFGGFGGEIELMNGLIWGLFNGKTNVCNDVINVNSVDGDDDKNDVMDILDCAIDFHCFPKMPEKVLARITNKKHKYSEDDIRSFIWKYDSRINVRNKVASSSLSLTDKDKEEQHVWMTMIKPKCDVYRYYIRKMINCEI